MATLKLSAPWFIRVRELEEMFKYDSEVRVVFDEETHIVSLYVDNVDKAAALTELLPALYTFGSYNLQTAVVPANDISHLDAANEHKEYLYEIAFEGNPVFSYAKEVWLGTNTLTYVVFRKAVVQYFTDDLSDANGICSTLYQEIAKNLFGEAEGVSFCTDVEEELKDFNLTHQWP